MKTEKLSFVIPCYKSENTIRAVIEEIIRTVSEKDEYDYEIIAVNDCSPDHLMDVLEEMADQNKKIKVIEFAKNMTRIPALMAGYKKAQGDIIVHLDDDGQSPMNELWRLIEPLYHGEDAAIAKYPTKKQKPFKNWGSRLNARMSEFMISKPKDLQISNFVAMKRFVVQEIINYQNPYPSFTGLLLRSTSHIVNVPMEQRERIFGTSTYTLRKLISLWLNGFTSFSVKPLRIATVIGFVCSLLGIVYGIVVVIFHFTKANILPGYSSVMAAILFIGGVLMILLGIIGEYVGRIYISINNAPQYVIRKEKNFDSDDQIISNNQ